MARRTGGGDAALGRAHDAFHDRAGISAWSDGWATQPQLVVVEATGGLQRQVVAALWLAGIAVAAVIRRGCATLPKAAGSWPDRSQDAESPALFAERDGLSHGPRPTPRPRRCRSWVMRCEQLLEMLVAESNA